MKNYCIFKKVFSLGLRPLLMHYRAGRRNVFREQEPTAGQGFSSHGEGGMCVHVSFSSLFTCRILQCAERCSCPQNLCVLTCENCFSMFSRLHALLQPFKHQNLQFNLDTVLQLWIVATFTLFKNIWCSNIFPQTNVEIRTIVFLLLLHHTCCF